MKQVIFFGALLLGGCVSLLVGCAPRSEYVTFTGFQQGTTYSIIVRDPAPDTAQRIDSVFREIDLTFSIFNPESLVSRINRGETDRVTPLFEECFRLAKQIHADTEGFYDPTVKPLVDAWGFGPGEMRRRPNIDSLMEFVGMDKIWLSEIENDPETGDDRADETGGMDESGGASGDGSSGLGGDGAAGGRIVKADWRVQLDFSSIAKGFTVDRMAEMLARTSGGRTGSAKRVGTRGWLSSEMRSGRSGNVPDEAARKRNSEGGSGSGSGGGSGERNGERSAGKTADEATRERNGEISGRLAAGRRRNEGGRANEGPAGEKQARRTDGSDFLVEIGGEVRARGVNRQGVAWRIQIDRPEGGFAHQQAAVITLGGRPNSRNDRDGKGATQSGRDADGEAGNPSSVGGRARDDREEGLRGDSDGARRDDISPFIVGGAATQLTSVATSGNYRNWFADEDGNTRVHTLDPHTGAQAAGEILSASVVSASCALSDGWATALIAAHDLSTARRLLARTTQQSDADERPGIAQCPGGNQPTNDGRHTGATGLEWYIISNNGVSSSPGFPAN